MGVEVRKVPILPRGLPVLEGFREELLPVLLALWGSSWGVPACGEVGSGRSPSRPEAMRKEMELTEAVLPRLAPHVRHMVEAMMGSMKH